MRIPGEATRLIFRIGGEEGERAYRRLTEMVAEGAEEAGEAWRAFVDRQIARGLLTRQQADDLTYLAGRGALAASVVGPVGRVERTARRNRIVIPMTDRRFHFPRTQPTGRIGGGNRSGTPAQARENMSAEQRYGVRAQNRSAQILDRSGYGVHQLDEGELSEVERRSAGIGLGKNPDYLIEGRVFDNYAPLSDNLRTVHGEVRQKVSTRQAFRIVVNLHVSHVTRAEIEEALNRDPIRDLQEVIVIDQAGRITHAFPPGR